MREFPPQGDSEMARYEPGDYRINVPVSVAREGIERSCPDLEIGHIEPYGKGVGDAIFRVNGDYLFKFAKHEKASKILEKEMAMLPELQGHVGVPIPEVRYAGRYHGRNDEQLFFGYKEIIGRGMKREDVQEDGVIKENLVGQLVEFMDGVQAYDVAKARERGVPEVDPRAHYEREREDARRELYPFLKARFPVEASELERFIEESFEKYLGDENNFDFEPKLIHGDLEGPNAVLYDEERDEIAGVLDFGGLEITDPDRELWRLYAHYGKDFTDKILELKPHPNQGLLYGKMNFFWTAQEVHRMVRRLMVEGPDGAALLMERLRRRMEATS